MRKIFLFMNVSLDGYFEGPGHDITGFTNDFEAFSDSQGGDVDTLLYGHRTYDMMKVWGTPKGQEMMPAVADFMTNTNKIVVSHKDFDPGWSKVSVVTGDVVGQIRAYKEQGVGSMAMFGSNNLCVSLMEAGLVDEFQIMLNPVALGAGTPLFSGLSKKVPFRLVTSKTFKSGTVLHTYTVA